MSEHLSRKEIENYIARDLAPAEILRIDDHLAACSVCMKLAKPISSAEAILDVLEAETTDSHLRFATMSELVDGKMAGSEREIADVHLAACAECANTLDDLRAMRDALETDSSGSVDRTVSQANPIRPFAWWKFAIPAAAIVILGIVVWTMFGTRSGTDELANTSNSVNTNIATADSNKFEIASNTAISNSEKETRPVVASLNDAAGRIEIDPEGRITGINSDQFEQKLRAALTSQTINISSDAQALKSSAGTLMGPPSPGLPFKLIGPVGRVVEMERPPFRWRPMQGAESYKVGVYDENFQLVAESPELKTTNWTPNTSLPRGRVYQWQVKAVVDGKEVISPTRPAAEAKFKIVDAATAAEIQRAHRAAGNSNLLMGIVYANAGMLAEAEREFQSLVQKNPDSEIARRLLSKVKTAK